MSDDKSDKKWRRGFASMTPERRRAIAAAGGRAAQAAGTSYRWTPETASEAGKIGGARSGAVRAAKKQQQTEE